MGEYHPAKNTVSPLKGSCPPDRFQQRPFCSTPGWPAVRIWTFSIGHRVRLDISTESLAKSV